MRPRPTAIRLRPARADDSVILLVWTNDPATRAASFDREMIGLPEHAAWLAAVLADPNRRLWVAEEGTTPVGQVRVDRVDLGLGMVSIGLAPDARGRGLGASVLRIALARAADELTIQRARAVVRASNAPARRLFEAAGFATIGSREPGGPDALVMEADLDATPQGTGGLDAAAGDAADPRSVLLRADASAGRGTGHVVRCVTLGAALRAAGWLVTLVSHELAPSFRRTAEAAGIGVLTLPSALPLDDEPDYLQRVLSRPAALLVADHYLIRAAWLARARCLAGVLMAIDDLADRRLPVDLVLNQNLGAAEARYRGLVPPGTRTLAGPQYALVRPEFSGLRARGRSRAGQVDRVLVFMSGADEDDVTRRAASGAVAAGVAVDVVVGAVYPHLAALRAWVAEQPLATLHVDTPGMAVLMERADLAVGAPSSASWERCTLGLPSVLISLADNQLEAERLLVEHGAASTLGWHASITESDVTQAVVSLKGDPARVRAMSRAAAAVTDGKGTTRVVAAIEDVAKTEP